ncbi:nitrate transporter 1.1 [Wolffia australiana]
MASLPKTDVGETISDAWNYKGRPAVRSLTGGWTAAASILVVELNERLASLGIAVNLVTYMTGTMHLGNATAANTVTNFLGTSFMLCLLGGFIADTFLGRYLTISIFAAIQATGVTILTISTSVHGLRPPSCAPSSSSCIPANGMQLGVLYLALYMTALGTGGLKSSVSGLGSDQFDESDPSEKKGMLKFFNWFFFLISLGSLLAVTVLVYVQDHVGRRWGYGICATCILLGLFLFLSRTRSYRFKKLVGSPLTQISAVLFSAWRNRALPFPDQLYEEPSSKQSLPRTTQFRFLDRAAIKQEGERSKWRVNTVTDVEEVKMLARMLPIWATTIMFWTVYAQMTTLSVSQATTMDCHVAGSFQIPPGSLTVFFVASILLTVPVYDRAVVPLTRRLTGNPQGLSPLQRIGVGLVMSAMAMAAAALTEVKRLRAATGRGDGPVPMTVFWLVPQFLLVGSGEAFTYIGQLDFFLRECPSGMKTMSTGLFLSTLSLGFFLSSLLVSIVDAVTGKAGRGAWIADNLNQGRLYNFYWLLAALSLANFAVFLVAARWYTYRDRPESPAEDDKPSHHA